MDRKTSSRRTQEKNRIRLITPGPYKYFSYIILICIFLSVFTGCDKYTSYKVLTFFFTGVPHPDRVDSLPEERAGLSGEEILRKRKEDITIVSYTHGPYGAQQCFQCHSTSQTATFRSSAENKGKSVIKTDQNVSGRLVMPVKELCIDCHSVKSVNSAFSRGLWIHGPVSEGICITCHSPHASTYPYMLKKGTSREICTLCHAQGLILDTEDHRKNEDCTSCHNPHLGKTRFLLKKDFDEGLLN
ncbi:MAG: hypothetical protein C4581_14055 [Nitrospiraceae bacterium]|nr:MAG: hypothetical protein C4581_14055 [Nitrospiraceae bacterium]